MLLSHKRSLWPDMERWREETGASATGVVRLAGGTLAVADAQAARGALLGPAENYVRHSAFLRIGQQILTDEQRAQAVSGLLSVLGRHAGERVYDLHELIGYLGGGQGRLAHQGWGVRAVQAHFAPALATGRTPELSQLVNTYVCTSTIASAVVGRAMWRTRRTELGLRRQFAEILRGLPAPAGEPADVIDVVLGLDGDFTPIERAQLLQRLILSAVGFTGITLEWAILLAYQSGRDSAELTEAQARLLVQEALRLYPTAWRLWREAGAPHTVGGCPVEHGGQVMIDLHALHRSAAVWDAPDEFDPDRWAAATREQRAAYLPFGKGEQMCPANGFALRALEELCLSILREYHGEVSFTGKRPHARTLLAPPRGWTKVARRTG
jgi:hypothetical protein